MQNQLVALEVGSIASMMIRTSRVACRLDCAAAGISKDLDYVLC